MPGETMLHMGVSRGSSPNACVRRRYPYLSNGSITETTLPPAPPPIPGIARPETAGGKGPREPRPSGLKNLR
jgi:hypothetical protein